MKLLFSFLFSFLLDVLVAAICLYGTHVFWNIGGFFGALIAGFIATFAVVSVSLVSIFRRIGDGRISVDKS